MPWILTALISMAIFSLPKALGEKQVADKALCKVALTFDDGPEKGVTSEILQELIQHDVPAGFFWFKEKLYKKGKLNSLSNKIISKMDRECSGCVIYDHSVSHGRRGTKGAGYNPRGLAAEMTITARQLRKTKIFDVDGKGKKIPGTERIIRPSLIDQNIIRMPGGTCQGAARRGCGVLYKKMAKERLVLAHWDGHAPKGDPMWRAGRKSRYRRLTRKPQDMLNHMCNNGGGGVILLHDVVAHNPLRFVRDIIKIVKKNPEKYGFGTVAEVLYEGRGVASQKVLCRGSKNIKKVERCHRAKRILQELVAAGEGKLSEGSVK